MYPDNGSGELLLTDITGSLPFPKAYCHISYAPCTTRETIYEACSSKYNGDLKYLYCLCTTGYHESGSLCDACDASTDSSTNLPSLSSKSSSHESECSSYTDEYASSGRASSARRTSTRVSPARPSPEDSDDRVAATTTGDAAARETGVDEFFYPQLNGNEPAPRQGAGSAQPTSAAVQNSEVCQTQLLLTILSAAIALFG